MWTPDFVMSDNDQFGGPSYSIRQIIVSRLLFYIRTFVLLKNIFRVQSLTIAFRKLGAGFAALAALVAIEIFNTNGKAPREKN